MSNYSFTKDMSRGLSLRMKGKVLVRFVFVDTKNSVWLPSSKTKFRNKVKAATDDLVKQASAAGVPLSFVIEERLLTIPQKLEKKPSSDIFGKISEQFLREENYTDHRSFRISMKKAHQGVDEVAVAFVLKPSFRAFARRRDEWEFCALYEDNAARVIAHELLHLFGAADLYYPYHILGLSKSFFPDSVMCSGVVVDDLTQYLVGWHSSPSTNVTKFLEKTCDFTLDRFYQANDLEWYRGKEADLLGRKAPYASMLDLRKAGMKGDFWAEFLLGICYRDGIGVEKKTERAEAYFERSGKTGLTIACFAHAQLLLCRRAGGTRDLEMLELMLHNSENCHLQMETLRLACMLTGRGLKQNRAAAISEALERHKGAETYNRYARRSAYFYAVAQELSVNVPQLHEVIKRMRCAYDRVLQEGDPDLQLLVARLYENGESVRKNRTIAFKLYKKAAESGSYLACQELARCFCEEVGTEYDGEAARMWRKKATQLCENDPWNAFCQMMRVQKMK